MLIIWKWKPHANKTKFFISGHFLWPKKRNNRFPQNSIEIILH